ncbi:DUF2189 domain-containing protein [Hyphobacterium sp. HN65]|uniref:DUF2189 domain-containing protein n=1 Tax=Hyphobacterium lacteum TaxID=3116575 RepID=A0ABU7LRJ8_9PROT|nr:DUF2189 domain-containing protein [Hyphobacterium sp. HN65]MEE2526528.1 DUF2189 domain-containing protein [Hyphobacterium sp. HN65]
MAAVQINDIRPGAPMRWLKAGAGDMARAPMVSIGYGLIFVAIGAALSLGLWFVGAAAWIPVALSSFALIAPLFAVGIYQISKHIDEGKAVTFSDVWLVSGEKISQVAFLGLLLIILLLGWARIAQFLYAYFASQDYTTLSEFTSWLLGNPAGLAMAVIGTVIGGMLALAAFAISAISFPMLIDKQIDAATALIASVTAVRRNLFPMLTWAWLIAFWTVIGTAFFGVGLAIVFPWLGHASWRAYQDFCTDCGPSSAG